MSRDNVKLSAVAKGEPVTLPCSDDTVGWYRVPAPDDGVLVECGELTAFVPWADIRKLRRKVKAK